MGSAHRRMEIISILSARGHATMRELAWELDVTRRMIMNDIIALSFDYPIYTKPGEGRLLKNILFFDIELLMHAKNPPVLNGRMDFL